MIAIFATTRHREMLDQVLSLFAIEVDVDLDAMRPGQGLAELTARLMEGLDLVLKRKNATRLPVAEESTRAIADQGVGLY